VHSPSGERSATRWPWPRVTGLSSSSVAQFIRPGYFSSELEQELRPLLARRQVVARERIGVR